MNTIDFCLKGEQHPSVEAKRRILSVRGDPLFYADWIRVVFIHYEIDPKLLQPAVPFELDLHDGKAYVSLVAFTMRGMRPCFGGKLTEWLFKPIATHHFLNVRTYVRHNGEPGIHFLAEWLSNPLSVKLGPSTFGLPYRFGKLDYRHEHENECLEGKVTDAAFKSTDGKEPSLEYHATMDWDANFTPCEAGSLTEFLMERYTAFTARKSWRGFFRIWHPPWPQTPIQLEVLDTSLLTKVWPWFRGAKFVGANYSPGIQDVWMGRPHLARELKK